MAPSAIDETVSRRDAWKGLPPPTLYPVKEAKFTEYLAPHLDGREQALGQPSGQAAIVIDNGRPCLAPHSSRNMLTRATAPCRLLGRPRGLVVRHGSATRHPAHHVQVPGPEGEQDVLLCRPGLLRRHHRAGAHPQRLRGRHRHREQLGCHGARPRPRLHQAWHERRRGRCRHAHRHDRGRRQPPVLAEE